MLEVKSRVQSKPQPSSPETIALIQLMARGNPL